MMKLWTVVACLVAAGQAAQFSNSAFNVQAGTTFTIGWTAAAGQVSLQLRNGSPSDLKPILTIASDVAPGPGGVGSFAWSVPSTLPGAGPYAFVISDDTGYGYSIQFEVQGVTVVATSSVSGSPLPATSASTSVAQSTSAQTASAQSTSTAPVVTTVTTATTAATASGTSSTPVAASTSATVITQTTVVSSTSTSTTSEINLPTTATGSSATAATASFATGTTLVSVSATTAVSSSPVSSSSLTGSALPTITIPHSGAPAIQSWPLALAFLAGMAMLMVVQ